MSTLYAPSVPDTPAIILGSKRILELNSDLGVSIAVSPKVSSWADQGSLGNTVVQATSARQLTQVLSVLDGHAAIRSDGVDDCLQRGGSFTGLAAGDRPYIYCVYAQRSGGASYTDTIVCLDTDGVAGGATHLCLLYHTTSSMSAYNGGNAANAVEGGLVARLVTARLEATGLALDINNTNVATGGTPGLVPTPTWLTLASRIQTGSVNGATDYFRVVIANPTPTAAQHTRMIAYLKKEYPSIGLP